jgi:hypothetical protein
MESGDTKNEDSVDTFEGGDIFGKKATTVLFGEVYGREVAVHIDPPEARPPFSGQFRLTLIVDGDARFSGLFKDKRESDVAKLVEGSQELSEQMREAGESAAQHLRNAADHLRKKG